MTYGAPPLLQVKDLDVKLPTCRGIVHAVNRVSFELTKGKTLGIVGESGCGKSVLCRALLGLLPRTAQFGKASAVCYTGENLIGRSEKNAIFEIKRLKLELRHVTYEHSAHFPEGVVIQQSIVEEEEVKVGRTIDLIVSFGKFPDKFIVPNLIGRSLPDAKKIIQQAGLTYGNISYQVQDDLLPETIIDQSIEANSEVMQGDTLHLLVSRLATVEDTYE